LHSVRYDYHRSKNIVLLLLLPVLLLWTAPAQAYKHLERPDIPGLVVEPDDAIQRLTAKSAALIEAGTGKVIYERNMNERRYPASTTKIMTLIIALERGNLDDEVTISSNAEGMEGSTLWLERGDKVTLRELLRGMMMHSGNDAAVAVAEHIAGSVPEFARLMTQRAHELGAVDTNFATSCGLPDPDHYTTAHDMALIAAHGYSLPEFEDIVSTKEATFDWVHDDTHMLRNENQLLWLYDGSNGVKTGYTDAAGRCLVSAARRNGIQLVAVVLDSVFMWNDSMELLDYGFANVSAHEAVRQGETVSYAHVRSGKTSSLPLQAAQTLMVPDISEQETKPVERVVELDGDIEAPVRQGDVVGRLILRQDGRDIASTELLAARDVDQKSFFHELGKLWQQIWSVV